MKRLAIVCTHPIQYNAPLFQLLTDRKKIQIKVFYTWERGAENFDEGFGKSFKWDIPLLEGYDYVFVSNAGNKGKRFWDVRNPSLIKEIELWKPNAVLAYGWNYLSHLRVMRHFKGKVKVLFRGDSTLIGEKTGIKQFLRTVFLSWVYSNIDFALYVGKKNKEYFLRHGVKENKLFFVPHAIDNKRFSGSNGSINKYKEDLLNSLGSGNEQKTLLFAGKFQEKKNVRLLINGFAEADLKNWRLILVGNGEEENKLKELAFGQKNIFFLPFQNQKSIPAVYQLGDVFCLPSIGSEETWGLAVNEAMAAGRPVIVSDSVGCAADLVEEGVNGFVFKSGNKDSLVEKLRLIATMDMQQMGRVSKEKVNNWSFEVQASNIETLFSKFD